MGTIIGLNVETGTILAGDQRITDGTTVQSDSKQKVFDFDTIGTAVTGDPGGIDAFERQFAAEIQEYRTERDEVMGIQRLATLSATIAETERTEAIVSAHDDTLAQIREVGSDGRILDGEVLALGSGAQTALGQLEETDLDVDLDTAASLARDVLDTVAEHDTATGPNMDVWQLEHATET